MRDDSSPWILFLRREKVNLFNFLLFVYLFFPSNQLDFVYFFSSSTSSNSSFEVSDSNEHLLDFVVTTVDQIDFSLYNAFESMTNRVSKILVDSYFSIFITYFLFFSKIDRTSYEKAHIPLSMVARIFTHSRCDISIIRIFKYQASRF